MSHLSYRLCKDRFELIPNDLAVTVESPGGTTPSVEGLQRPVLRAHSPMLRAQLARWEFPEP